MTRIGSRTLPTLCSQISQFNFAFKSIDIRDELDLHDDEQLGEALINLMYRIWRPH